MLGALQRPARCLVYALVVVAAAVFLLLGIVPKLTPLEGRTITSTSMEPAIPAGALVLVDTAASEPPGAGDVVMFDSPDHRHPVVHRIAAVHEDGGERSYTTRGDANPSADRGRVADHAVIGTARWSLPYLGSLVLAATSPTGAALLLALPAAGIMAMELPRWYRYVRDGPSAFLPPDEPTDGPNHEPDDGPEHEPVDGPSASAWTARSARSPV